MLCCSYVSESTWGLDCVEQNLLNTEQNICLALDQASQSASKVQHQTTPTPYSSARIPSIIKPDHEASLETNQLNQHLKTPKPSESRTTIYLACHQPVLVRFLY